MVAPLDAVDASVHALHIQSYGLWRPYELHHTARSDDLDCVRQQGRGPAHYAALRTALHDAGVARLPDSPIGRAQLPVISR